MSNFAGRGVHFDLERRGSNSAGVGAHLIPRGSTSTGGGPLLPSVAWVCTFISNGNFRVM